MLSAKQTQLFDVFTRPFRGTERGPTNEATVKEIFYAKRQTVAKLHFFSLFRKTGSGKNGMQRHRENREEKLVISGQSHLHFVSLI